MKKYLILCFTMKASCAVFASPVAFHYTIQAIPQPVQEKMKSITWHKGCPVSLTNLSYLKLNYWGFDNKTHVGELIVHKSLAKEVVAIFKVLFQHHYPIQRMQLMNVYDGDDNLAMADNNSSAFNCRAVTNRPGEYSQHSYGRAIDLNTLINPYVKKGKVSPKEGSAYLNRTQKSPGKIIKGDYVYRAFTNRGWSWGGNWRDAQDYQHFEKRAHGKKRNPDGYDS